MRLKTLSISLLLLVAVGIPTELFAKAAYYRKADMIQMAEAIAVITITAVDSTVMKGSYWTYRQVATANVEKVLKGTISNDIKLYGGEDFICAKCHYTTGKFLVFLKRDGELLTGCNWHLSIRPIMGDNIEWYKDDKSLELENKPLDRVLDEVGELIRQAAISGEEQCAELKKHVHELFAQFSSCNDDLDCTLLERECGCAFPLNKSAVDTVRESMKARDEFCRKHFPAGTICAYICTIGTQSLCIKGKCEKR